MKNRISTFRKKGSSLVETVCGCIILVLVALFLVDVAAVVICQTQNDALAKHCARAGASQPDAGKAATAISDVVTSFQAQNGASKMCVYVSDTGASGYDPASATCYVKTVVNCIFPVPIPFGPTQMNFQADCIEPITATLP